MAVDAAGLDHLLRQARAAHVVTDDVDVGWQVLDHARPAFEATAHLMDENHASTWPGSMAIAQTDSVDLDPVHLAIHVIEPSFRCCAPSSSQGGLPGSRGWARRRARPLCPRPPCRTSGGSCSR